MQPIVWRWIAAVSLVPAVVAAAERPRYGGVLRVAVRAAPQTFDPADPRFGPLVLERLVRIDDQGRLHPALAESWQPDAAGTRWEFRLRSGVTFHDGSPLAVSGIAATFGARARGNSLVFQFERPVPDLVLEMAGPRGVVLRRPPGGEPVGTGPFRVQEWESQRRFVLAANEDHWGGRPYLDSIEVQLGRSPREHGLDLELGRADVVELDPAESRRAARRGVPTWVSRPVELMALVAGEVDARLREALALSIDRSAIHNVLLQRQGVVAAGLLPHWLTGYAHLFSSARDLDTARKRVAEVAAPRPLTVSYDAADDLARAVAERIAVNARDAGLVIRLSAASSDFRLLRWRAGSLALGPALAELARASGLTPPEAVTIEDAFEAERIWIEEYRVIPLVHLPEIYGLGPRVRNWQGWRLDEVWLDEEPQP